MKRVAHPPDHLGKGYQTDGWWYSDQRNLLGSRQPVVISRLQGRVGHNILRQGPCGVVLPGGVHISPETQGGELGHE